MKIPQDIILLLFSHWKLQILYDFYSNVGNNYMNFEIFNTKIIDHHKTKNCGSLFENNIYIISKSMQSFSIFTVQNHTRFNNMIHCMTSKLNDLYWSGAMFLTRLLILYSTHARFVYLKRPSLARSIYSQCPFHVQIIK